MHVLKTQLSSWWSQGSAIPCMWWPFSTGLGVVCGSHWTVFGCSDVSLLRLRAGLGKSLAGLCGFLGRLWALRCHIYSFLIYSFFMYIFVLLSWAPLRRWMPRSGAVSRAFDTTLVQFKGWSATRVSLQGCCRSWDTSRFFTGNPLGPTV